MVMYKIDRRSKNRNTRKLPTFLKKSFNLRDVGKIKTYTLKDSSFSVKNPSSNLIILPLLDISENKFLTYYRAINANV